MKIGIITDVHIGTQPTTGTRDANALTKLAEFVQDMSTWGPDVVVNIGDFIDYGWDESMWDAGIEVLSGLNCEVVHVYGNHEYQQYYDVEQTVTRDDWMVKTGTEMYFVKTIGNIDFIVLDCSYNIDGTGYPLNYFSAYIPYTQKQWLISQLQASTRKKIIFTHYGIDGDSAEEASGMRLKNGNEIRSIVHTYGNENVLACFCGHSHVSEYRKGHNKYYSINSMKGVEVGANYAKITVAGNELFVDAVGIGNDYNNESIPTKIIDITILTIKTS